MCLFVNSDIDNLFIIYGPQKGEDDKMVRDLDKLSEVIKRDCCVDVRTIAGFGATGGMGEVWLHSSDQNFRWVLRLLAFHPCLRGRALSMHGRGKIDGQSLRGKVVIGVAREAKRKGVKTIAFVGDIADDITQAYEEGVSAIFSINRGVPLYKEQRPRAKSDLYLTLDNLLRF